MGYEPFGWLPPPDDRFDLAALGASVTDWVGAVASIVSVIFAVAAASVATVIARRQKRIAAMDAYTKLDSRLRVPAVVIARSTLGRAYLERREPDAETVRFALTPFEAIAFAVRRKIVDADLVWSWIGDLVLVYCLAFSEQIRSDRADQSTYWEELKWLTDKLTEMNRDRNVRDWPDGWPNATAIERHLTREATLQNQARAAG